MTIGFHGHNDLGMATANTLSAIQGDAWSVDVTVNGLGERAGNAPLEEVVMALRVSLDRDCGINARKFHDLCTFVAHVSGRPLPASKPITGTSVFCHESGIHVRALLEDRRTYEPFPAEEVGGQQAVQVMIGKHSGSAAVRHVLAGEGIPIGPEDAQRLLAKAPRAFLRSLCDRGRVSDLRDSWRCTESPCRYIGQNGEQPDGRCKRKTL
jgi:homocitrate synthase NifV